MKTKTNELRVKALNAAISYLVAERWARKEMEPLQRIHDGLNAKYGGMFNDLASGEDFKLRDKVARKLSEYAKIIADKREEAALLARGYIEAAEPGADFFYPPEFAFGEEDGTLYVPVSIDGRPRNYPLNSDPTEYKQPQNDSPQSDSF